MSLETAIPSADALGDSTRQLPITALLAFSLPVAEMMFFVPADVIEPSIAQTVYVLALPLSAALSAFSLTFSLLEGYYIAMIKSLVAERQSHHHDRPHEMSDADFAQRLTLMLYDFEPMRARARNCMWGGLCSLMLGVASKYVSMAGWTFVSITAGGTLFAGIIGVLYTVKVFRQVYWPFIHEARR